MILALFGEPLFENRLLFDELPILVFSNILSVPGVSSIGPKGVPATVLGVLIVSYKGELVGVLSEYLGGVAKELNVVAILFLEERVVLRLFVAI